MSSHFSAESLNTKIESQAIHNNPLTHWLTAALIALIEHADLAEVSKVLAEKTSEVELVRAIDALREKYEEHGSDFDHMGLTRSTMEDVHAVGLRTVITTVVHRENSTPVPALMAVTRAASLMIRDLEIAYKLNTRTFANNFGIVKPREWGYYLPRFRHEGSRNSLVTPFEIWSAQLEPAKAMEIVVKLLERDAVLTPADVARFTAWLPTVDFSNSQPREEVIAFPLSEHVELVYVVTSTTGKNSPYSYTLRLRAKDYQETFATRKVDEDTRARQEEQGDFVKKFLLDPGFVATQLEQGSFAIEDWDKGVLVETLIDEPIEWGTTVYNFNQLFLAENGTSEGIKYRYLPKLNAWEDSKGRFAIVMETVEDPEEVSDTSDQDPLVNGIDNLENGKDKTTKVAAVRVVPREKFKTALEQQRKIELTTFVEGMAKALLFRRDVPLTLDSLIYALSTFDSSNRFVTDVSPNALRSAFERMNQRFTTAEINKTAEKVFDGLLGRYKKKQQEELRKIKDRGRSYLRTASGELQGWVDFNKDAELRGQCMPVEVHGILDKNGGDPILTFAVQRIR